jgi:REP element-mobilizing transposase RayT
VNPIVIAYHLIWTAYGFWLPTDPRGSMSKWVVGRLHYGRKKIQPKSWEIREYLRATEDVLKFPRLTLNSEAILCIGRAFETVIEQCKYTCYACAIMPDHVHILIRKHKHPYEEMVRNLQRESHLLLRAEGFRDFEHPTWGGHGWSVFLDHPTDIWRTIPYIEQNPTKIGLAAQKWGFREAIRQLAASRRT